MSGGLLGRRCSCTQQGPAGTLTPTSLERSGGGSRPPGSPGKSPLPAPGLCCGLHLLLCSPQALPSCFGCCCCSCCCCRPCCCWGPRRCARPGSGLRLAGRAPPPPAEQQLQVAGSALAGLHPSSQPPASAGSSCQSKQVSRRPVSRASSRSAKWRPGHLRRQPDWQRGREVKSGVQASRLAWRARGGQVVGANGEDSWRQQLGSETQLMRLPWQV